MGAFDSELSRISKMLIDRDQASAEAALARRQECGVTLCCGDDVASSYTLQLAVLTAASIASRCFPGAVRIAEPPGLANPRGRSRRMSRRAVADWPERVLACREEI
jgi:hypothetical protein